jgi:uncharacterized protein (DUF169 family)
MSVQEYNAYGEALERLLRLRTDPIAVKMIETENDIPAGAIRPRKDRGYHLAQCQAFAMSRRQNETVAMLKEDHWCFAPLMAYGLVEDPDDEFVNTTTHFPRFPEGKYIGMVTGPLKTATFEPDMVLVYADPGQIVKLLMAVKFGDGALINSIFDPIDSCAYAIVPVIEEGEYRITIPDPGEIARAAVRGDKVIFSIPKHKLQVIVEYLKTSADSKQPSFETVEMRPDFPRPEFYDRLFRKWGLDTEPENR